MRLFAWLLIVVSLVAALVAAITAYSPKLETVKSYLPDVAPSAGTQPAESDDVLTLNAPAGRVVVDGAPRPVAPKDTVLTPDLVDRLIASGERRARVKEFRWRLWRELPIFVLGCVGMLAGALVVRRDTARRLAPATDEAAAAGAGPDASVQNLRAALDDLRGQVAQANDRDARIKLIIERVDEMNAQFVAPFVAARPQLVARMGLAGYAQLMDRFAAGERQLNRAWSAAADGYEEEAVACLDNASVLFAEAEQRMR